jgi:putative serine protease PepD
VTTPTPPPDPFASWTQRPPADPWGPPAGPDAGAAGRPAEDTAPLVFPAAPDTLGRPLQPPRRRVGAVVAGAVLLTVVAALLGGLAGAWYASRDDDQLTDTGASLGAVPTGSLSRPADSVAGIAQRVLPTVVSIEVSTGAGGGTGSGFVIRSDGYVLTNNHVVTDAAGGGEIAVQFNDGSLAAAQIVGRSPSYDLAVLKVDRTGLPVAVLGDSDAVVVGDSAIAVGSPLGLAGTVTSGIISAKNRPVTTGRDDGTERSYISALQTDAAINPGNSGGPLVDGQAKVIGVNSAIATLSGGLGQSGSIGLGFSIPINQARRVAEELIQDGVATYPIIGANLDAQFAGDGIRLAAVVDGGPADAAGLQAGDVVTSIDGQPVSQADDLIVEIRRRAPGDTIEITYERDGQEGQATVTLGSAEG